MRQIKFLVVLLALLTLLVGCSTSGGRQEAQHATRVDLTKANYRVIKAGAEGTSSGFNLFGIALSSPSYVEAMNELRSQAPMEGKATAVANVVQEKSKIWLLLFSIPKVTVTADIVEFIGNDGTQ